MPLWHWARHSVPGQREGAAGGPSLPLASSPAWPQACAVLWALERRQTPPPGRSGRVPEADVKHTSWSKAEGSLEPEPRSLRVQARLPVTPAVLREVGVQGAWQSVSQGQLGKRLASCWLCCPLLCV